VISGCCEIVLYEYAHMYVRVRGEVCRVNTKRGSNYSTRMNTNRKGRKEAREMESKRQRVCIYKCIQGFWCNSRCSGYQRARRDERQKTKEVGKVRQRQPKRRLITVGVRNIGFFYTRVANGYPKTIRTLNNGDAGDSKCKVR